MFLNNAFMRGVAATFFLSLFGSTTQADELRYEAIWQNGKRTSLTTAPLALDVFRSTGQNLANNGLRLIDVETRVLNGNRVYAGLWTQGTGSNFFVGPLRPVPFRA